MVMMIDDDDDDDDHDHDGDDHISLNICKTRSTYLDV